MPVTVTSPQGRFVEGAAAVSGRAFTKASAWGKHLFHHYQGGRVVHVHLGLYGAFGYDLAFQFEDTALTLERPGNQRDMVLFLPDRILRYDVATQRGHVYSYDFGVDGASTRGLERYGPQFAYRSADAAASSHPPPSTGSGNSNSSSKSNSNSSSSSNSGGFMPGPNYTKSTGRRGPGSSSSAALALGSSNKVKSGKEFIQEKLLGLKDSAVDNTGNNDGKSKLLPVPFLNSPDIQLEHYVGTDDGSRPRVVGWRKDATPLAESGSGRFEVEVLLPPGKHEYKFVVNGDTWLQDKENPERTPDGNGGFNSVVHVGHRPAGKAGKRGDGKISAEDLIHDPDEPAFIALVDDERRAVVRLHVLKDDVTTARLEVAQVTRGESRGLDGTTSQWISVSAHA